jgi:hypothetical protein
MDTIIIIHFVFARNIFSIDNPHKKKKMIRTRTYNL